MNKWGRILFMSFLVTALAHGDNFSQQKTSSTSLVTSKVSSNKSYLKGYITKYYCEEYSLTAKDKKKLARIFSDRGHI